MICINRIGDVRIVDESECIQGDITEQTMTSQDDWKSVR